MTRILMVYYFQAQNYICGNYRTFKKKNNHYAVSTWL